MTDFFDDRFFLSPVSLFLSHAQLHTIYAHADRTYPDECCGLLLGNLTAGNKIVTDLWAMENAWDAAAADDLADDPHLNKTRRYWIAPQEMLAAIRAARARHLEIVGVYHSHPDHPAIPSEYDRQLAWAQYSYLIVSVPEGIASDARSWVLDDRHQFQPEPLLLTAPARM